jgi:hypothetical protein
MTLWQDLGIGEVILEDLTAVVSGQPASFSKTVEGITFTGSVVTLPNGPTGTSYVVFTGSVWQILGLLMMEGSAFAAGSPIQIAEKVGNTWLGYTFAEAKPAAATPAAPAA